MSPTITSLKPHRRKKAHYDLEFDDGETLVVHEETVLRSHLHEGDDIDHDSLRTLLSDDEKRRCRFRAWEILSHRPLPEREMKRRLQKSLFKTETINEVLERLRMDGFLDDEAWARQFTRERLARGEGPRLVESRLGQKGIARELAREVIGQRRDREAETLKAEEQLRKWNRRGKPEGTRERARAAAQWLCRRGFDPDIVWPLVRTFFTVEEE